MQLSPFYMIEQGILQHPQQQEIGSNWQQEIEWQQQMLISQLFLISFLDSSKTLSAFVCPTGGTTGVTASSLRGGEKSMIPNMGPLLFSKFL